MKSPEPLDTDPLQVLRQATAPLHQALDAGLSIGKADAKAADYAAHLALLAPWFARIEPCLRRVGWGLEYRAAVERDLNEARDLGLAAPTSAAEAAQAAVDGDLAFCWGVAYVAEGSQLGGQVLNRRLAHRIAPLVATYLQGRGGETGAHWGRFIAALRVALDDSDQAARACEGARWAFQLLIDARAAGASLPHDAADHSADQGLSPR